MTWRKTYDSIILTSWIHETKNNKELPPKHKNTINLFSLSQEGLPKYRVDLNIVEGYGNSISKRFKTKKEALVFVSKLKKENP